MVLRLVFLIVQVWCLVNQKRRKNDKSINKLIKEENVALYPFYCEIINKLTEFCSGQIHLFNKENVFES